MRHERKLQSENLATGARPRAVFVCSWGAAMFGVCGDVDATFRQPACADDVGSPATRAAMYIGIGATLFDRLVGDGQDAEATPD